MRELLPGFMATLKEETSLSGWWRTFSKRDGSVDADIRIPVPEGARAEEVLDAMSKYLRELAGKLGAGWWVSVMPQLDAARAAEQGFFYPVRGKGIWQISSWPQPMQNIGKVLEMVQQKIFPHTGSLTDEIVVRLLWNPEGRQPGRPRQGPR